eukprot:s2643_g7.t1
MSCWFNFQCQSCSDRGGHCRTSSASSRSQWALPDFICQQQIAVGTAGLHLPAPDRSGHCRTSSASNRSQWALPDFSLFHPGAPKPAKRLIR